MITIVLDSERQDFAFKFLNARDDNRYPFLTFCISQLWDYWWNGIKGSDLDRQCAEEACEDVWEEEGSVQVVERWEEQVERS